MKWAFFAVCVKLCKNVTTIFWRVGEKLINLQAKLSNLNNLYKKKGRLYEKDFTAHADVAAA